MIRIKDLHKSFGEQKVLNGINLEINDGETIAIIGRSGCGKSVLIKHIIGLLKPDKGYIEVDGKIVNELDEDELYELRKNFGFLFQGAALFDSLTVEENVGLALIENTRMKRDEIRKIVNEKLSLVNLDGINDKKPAELSGGMKKRVGLARALVTNPKYILYDEPTTGLDPISSDTIDQLIYDLSKKLKVTSIVVTHDMVSVRKVADRVAMIHDGKIYFDGTFDDFVNSDDQVIQDFIKRTGY
ncbi:MAG: ABC transporter ATP-binding protein [Ignavibacteria bacterium]|nr:ABC transporter ATP-binding protein [Ignavibacteria bacterium]